MTLQICPFCGELPKITKHFKEEQWNLIHRCPVIGIISIDWRDDHDQLISTWNTRAPITVTEWRCPHCNWFANDESSNMIHRVNAEVNREKSNRAGTEILSWTEVWRCPHCKTEFQFQNSNG